jgi:hypothetical protein
MTRECGVWVTEYRTVRALFGAEKEEMKWEWKRLEKEQNCNFY